MAVSEGLPDKNQIIDAFADGKRVPDLQFYDGDFTYGDDFYIEIDNVTHWRPLPLPPGGAE